MDIYRFGTHELGDVRFSAWGQIRASVVWNFVKIAFTRAESLFMGTHLCLEEVSHRV